MNDQNNFRVLDFLSVLNTHFKTEKSVSFYADFLKIPESALNSATQEILNLTAQEIIYKKLMEEAKWQLIYNENSLCQICLDLGFKSTEFLTAFFMENEGMEPEEFRSTYLTQLFKELH